MITTMYLYAAYSSGVICAIFRRFAVMTSGLSGYCKYANNAEWHSHCPPAVRQDGY